MGKDSPSPEDAYTDDPLATPAPRPRPDLDDRRRPLPLRPHDPLRDPVPRHRHGHGRRRDLHRRRAGAAGPLLGRAGLVGLWMVLVLHAPRRRHPGPPGRHPDGDPGHAGLLRIHPDAGRGPPRHGPVGHRGHWARTASRPRRASRSPPAPDHDIGLDVTPVAFGPVLLRNDDGRTSRFPRAMVTCRTDDGRSGSGWIEWNQPDARARNSAPGHPRCDLRSDGVRPAWGEEAGAIRTSLFAVAGKSESPPVLARPADGVTT